MIIEPKIPVVVHKARILRESICIQPHGCVPLQILLISQSVEMVGPHLTQIDPSVCQFCLFVSLDVCL